MRYVIKHGWPCGYDRYESDYIEDTKTGNAIVIFDPSEGEYEYGCPPEFRDLVLKALNNLECCYCQG